MAGKKDHAGRNQVPGGQEGEARVLAKVVCQLPQVESVRLSPVPSKSVTLENRKYGREVHCGGGNS